MGNWRDNSGWLSAQPLVERFGVSSADLADPFSSHEDGIVRLLDLSGNPLTGALPDSFLSLHVLSLDPSNTEVCAPPDPAFDGWLRRVILLQPDPFPRCSQ